MDGGFAFFDIVFFAMVAAFLILRLRSVLGRRTGNEKPERWTTRQPPADRTGRDARQCGAPARSRPTAPPTRRRSTFPPPRRSRPGLAQVRAADPSFDPRTFAEGAARRFRDDRRRLRAGRYRDASSAARRRGLREFRRRDQSAAAGQADAGNHAGRHQIGRCHRSAHGQPHRARHGEVRQRADQRHARCRAAPWSKAIRSRSPR